MVRPPSRRFRVLSPPPLRTALGLCALLVLGCGSTSADVEGAPCAQPQTVDCRAGVCDVLTIAGETSEQAGNFHGIADAVVRADPGVPGRLWLGYSYPRIHSFPQGGLIFAPSIHLARSDNGGQSWTFQSSLFTAAPLLGPAPGGSQLGFSGHEVVNFIPVDLGQGTSWFGIHMVYWAAPGMSHQPDARSFHFALSRASSPQGLATAPAQRLGASFSYPGQVDVDLNALHPSLQACGLWNEPALYFEAGALYLLAQCQVFRGGVPDDDAGRVVLFRAPAVSDVSRLSWSYLGTLADHALALELGDAKLMQGEIARGRDGQLLVFLNPSHWDDERGEEIHQGCRVLEIESLDPPTLRRCEGQLVVRARITGSDLEFGTSSCGYDPSSATGILFARRPNPNVDPRSGFSLHTTRIHP